MPRNPKIQREGHKLFIMTAIGRVDLQPSHDDRTRARYWRAVGPDGRPLSPFVGAVRIAAAWAVSTTSTAP